ncbi:MAG TPA: acyltransferase domain-containing protein [Actinomycetota bacterium]|nr:acyltransferase domain-containing protein [Actinomycetota bacterium]
MQTEIDRVAAWLGWPDGETHQLTELLASGARSGSLALPKADAARAVLARMDVPPHAIDEILAVMPAAEHDLEAWWLIDHLYSKLIDHVGPEYPPPWPAPAGVEDALRRYLHLFVFLGAVPAAVNIHSARGIPEETTWSTLRDVGLQVANYQRRHGVAGFDGAFWIWQHFRGAIFRLGRLQYNFWHVEFETDGFRHGDPALGVHIPAIGPLTPEACDDSVRQARAFFPKYFPDRPVRIATCGSWLLDEQLAEYLPESSNIVGFQRRFTPVAGWSRPGDEDVIRFVFGFVPESIDDLPQTTTLERAVVKHLRSGRHWQIRLGWFAL